MERSGGDSNRGNGCNNGVGPQINTFTSALHMDRQDDQWSAPPVPERREAMERQQITQASPPTAPPPY